MAQDDYIVEQGKMLEAAQKRLREGQQVKALKENAPDLFHIIDTEIGIEVSRMTQDKPLSYDEYLSTHGKVRGLIRSRDLLNSKEAETVQAKQEVIAIQENIERINNDQKQD